MSKRSRRTKDNARLTVNRAPKWKPLPERALPITVMWNPNWLSAEQRSKRSMRGSIPN